MSTYKIKFSHRCIVLLMRELSISKSCNLTLKLLKIIGGTPRKKNISAKKS